MDGLFKKRKKICAEKKSLNLKVKNVELNNIQSILLQEIKEKFYGKNECSFFPINYYILSVNSKKRVI
jgi:hypothetical protein